MELEKTLIVAAPRSRVWELLLDPNIMARCVPGTQSVEIISDVEYLAEIKVKISFIAARFKVRTKIVETRPPDYLRMEGTGEDSSVGSSMKQRSELFLTDLGDSNTEIRIKATADVLGRLGSFGLSVMRTKADRMWNEFGENFSAVAVRGGETDNIPNKVRPIAPAYTPMQDEAKNIGGQASADVQEAASKPDSREGVTMSAPQPRSAKAKWWQRIVGASSTNWSYPPGEQFVSTEQRRATDIYIELHRPNSVVKILWPISAAPEAARWLKEVQE